MNVFMRCKGMLVLRFFFFMIFFLSICEQNEEITCRAVYWRILEERPKYNNKKHYFSVLQKNIHYFFHLMPDREVSKSTQYTLRHKWCHHHYFKALSRNLVLLWLFHWIGYTFHTKFYCTKSKGGPSAERISWYVIQSWAGALILGAMGVDPRAHGVDPRAQGVIGPSNRLMLWAKVWFCLYNSC